MKQLLWFVCLLSLAVPATVFANGTAVEGDAPSWAERVILLLTNEARTDPQAALKDCTVCGEESCYKDPMPPVFWSHDLARAARFHSANLSSAGCFNHNSPCKLKASIAELYPSQCDGSTTCACEGEVKCNAGTATFERIALFGTPGSGENIAGGNSDPKKTFYQWFWEPTESRSCEFSMENGHRFNILAPGKTKLGVGISKNISTQDFGSGATPTGFSSGIHYPNVAGAVEFKVHYYGDSLALQGANLHLNNECKAMNLSVGTKTLGVLALGIELQDKCVPYAFEGKNSEGAALRYPARGYLLFNCEDKIWEDGQLPACANGNDIVDIKDSKAGDEACSFGMNQTGYGWMTMLLGILGIALLRRKKQIHV